MKHLLIRSIAATCLAAAGAVPATAAGAAAAAGSEGSTSQETLASARYFDDRGGFSWEWPGNPL